MQQLVLQQKEDKIQLKELDSLPERSISFTTIIDSTRMD